MTTPNLPFQPGGYYHVFNRVNGFEKLFFNEGNYYYFLRRFRFYLDDYLQVFAYCLMPNHYHFLVKIKDQKEKLPKGLSDQEISSIVSNQFRRFQISYSKAVNKQISRKGSLFMQNLKRKEITDNDSLLRVVVYIHSNPVEAGFVNSETEWKHSSYSILFAESKRSPWLAKKEVLDWFGDQNNFQILHEYLAMKKGDHIDRL